MTDDTSLQTSRSEFCIIFFSLNFLRDFLNFESLDFLKSVASIKINITIYVMDKLIFLRRICRFMDFKSDKEVRVCTLHR